MQLFFKFIFISNSHAHQWILVVVLVQAGRRKTISWVIVLFVFRSAPKIIKNAHQDSSKCVTLMESQFPFSSKNSVNLYNNPEKRIDPSFTDIGKLNNQKIISEESKVVFCYSNMQYTIYLHSKLSLP